MTGADALARVREAGGDDLVERLLHLDALTGAPREPLDSPAPPREGDAHDADVIVAGGGLWSLLPPLLAARGLRVVVVERARSGQTHREWNASRPELQALATCGLLTEAEIDSLVVARYAHGLCRFGGGGAYPVRGVLDCAVDAGRLLALARQKAQHGGVRFLDGHVALGHASSTRAVRVQVRGPHGTMDLTGSVLVDARGAASPFACADLVCPTVGGVLTGLAHGPAPDEVEPGVGEILATVDGIENGRQHVWEAFPGRPGETTVYLFYYARAGEPVSLTSLYARFFATRAAYKRGDATLARPTFGLIPGWSRLERAPRAPDARVVLVGDAAARHSPLTYCGFGATLRSLRTAADAIAERADVARTARGAPHVVHDAPIHSLTGVLARVMAARTLRGGELNALLDAAFHTLHDLGDGAYAALLRDEMDGPTFVAFLRETARRHPAVWGLVRRVLGPGELGRWSLGLAKALWRADRAS